MRALVLSCAAAAARASVRCATSFEKLVPEGLSSDDRFGASVANVGDVDGDGVEDLAVGAPGDAHGSVEQTNNAGAVYFVLRDGDGGARRVSKAVVDKGQKNDWFGSSVAAVGDVDGDGRSEVVVGAPFWDAPGRVDSGGVFVYGLNADGSVRSTQTYGARNRGSVHLGSSDNFGVSVAAVGDVDGDGAPDVAVGAHKYDDPETGLENVGCVYICYMDAKRNGVRDCVRLAAARHANVLDDPYPSLRTNDYFGASLASLGRDGDGHLELLVGASGVDDGGARAGAAFLLTVDKDGSVLKHRKYSAATEPLLALRGGDHFGSSFAAVHAGASILLYGGADAARNGGRTGAGAVFSVRLDAETKDVVDAYRIDGTTGGGPPLEGNDRFGSGVALVGRDELVVGARYDDDSGFDAGAVYRLALANASCPAPVPDAGYPDVAVDGSAPETAAGLSAFFAVLGLCFALLFGYVGFKMVERRRVAALGRAQVERGSTSCAVEDKIELVGTGDDDRAQLV